MTGFAEISFKGTRKEYYAYSSLELLPGQHVIVEADRGDDLGEVTATGAIAERKCSSSNGGCATPAPEKKVMRLARKDKFRELGLYARTRTVCGRKRASWSPSISSR